MQKELLSAYIDGEYVNNELTDEICQNKVLQESWANFHTIRSVMRQESNVLLGADFTAKIEMLIEQERIEIASPTVSQPTQKEINKFSFVNKFKSWFVPMTQVAVAATVCLVTVIGVQTFTTSKTEKEHQDMPVLQTLPFNNSVQAVSYNTPTNNVITPSQLEQKNKRTATMLQNYELQRRIYADGLSLQHHNEK
ncbi:sigma-E factor negative regulatory protein [Seminibacterium arietis]|uniref:Anti-sigma-E factor RseA n=1 Tax=Seminibacterium arietis TaxID=1173502 RepID=A0ABW3IAE4_9PAST